MNSISAGHSHIVMPRQASTGPAQNSQVSHGKSVANNPAQAAKAALVDRADLAVKPFGSLVSLFAKGLPLPPMESAGDAPIVESVPMPDDGASTDPVI
jgi:hypothetical protein